MWICVTATFGVTIPHGWATGDSSGLSSTSCPRGSDLLGPCKPKVNENGGAEPSQDRGSPSPPRPTSPKPSGLCLTETGLSHCLLREGRHLAGLHLIQPRVIRSVENIKSHSWVLPTSAVSAPRFLLAGNQPRRFCCGRG